MKSHSRSSTWRTTDCAWAGVPVSTAPSRKLMSTASTRYTLRCTKGGHRSGGSLPAHAEHPRPGTWPKPQATPGHR